MEGGAQRRMLKRELSCYISVANDMVGIKKYFSDSDLGYIDFTSSWVLTFWRLETQKLTQLPKRKHPKEDK